MQVAWAHAYGEAGGGKCNAYEVELPDDVDISPIFNISYLYNYHELDDEVFVLEDYLEKYIEEV